MHRQKLMSDIFENICSLARIIHTRDAHSLPSGMPTQSQIRILFMISHQGPQNVKQIAKRFEFTPSAATQLINNLVKDKLLTRKEDALDRRKIYIDLTNKGKKILKQAHKLHFEKIKKMFKPLSDKELIQLKNIYSKIINHSR